MSVSRNWICQWTSYTPAIHLNCRQPSLGELCNLGSSCSRRKGCHPLLILKTQFLLLEADFPCMPPATGAGGRHRCSSWVGAERQCPGPWRHPRAISYFPDEQKCNGAGLLAAELQGFPRQNSHLGASWSAQAQMGLSHQPGLCGKAGKALVSRAPVES